MHFSMQISNRFLSDDAMIRSHTPISLCIAVQFTSAYLFVTMPRCLKTERDGYMQPA